MIRHSRTKFSVLSKALIFMILFIFLITYVTICEIDPAGLTPELLKSLQETDSGTDQLMQLLKDNEDYLKESKPFYYYYLKAIKAIRLDLDYSTASSYLSVALEEAKSSAYPDEQLLILGSIVELSSFYGDISGLIDTGSAMVEIGRRHNRPDAIVQGAYGIAWGHYFIFDDQMVVEYLEIGAAKALEANDSLQIANFHFLLGTLQFSQKLLGDSIKNYNSALELLNSMDKSNYRVHSLITRSKGFLAVIDSSRGKPKEDVLERLDQLISDTINTAKYNKELLISLHGWKAEAYRNYRMIPEAIKSYEDCIELGKQIKHIQNGIDPLQHLRLQLADVYYENGDYQKSAKIYVEQSAVWNDYSAYKNSETSIAKVKGLAEQQMNERLELVNRLKSLDEEKILAQKKALSVSIILIVALIICILGISFEYARINSLKRTIYIQSITDELTQAYNRRKIMEVMGNELKESYVVALVDVDDFKLINDKHGHTVGDIVLAKIVETIKSILRDGDMVGRYGGEEFLVILKNTDIKVAKTIMEKIHKSVEELKWPQEGLRTTISTGMMRKCSLSSDELFQKVDQLLYEAKSSGKNCIAYKDCTS